MQRDGSRTVAPRADQPREPREPSRPRPFSRALLTVVWPAAGVLVALAAAVYVFDATGVFDNPKVWRQRLGSLLVFNDNSVWTNAIVFAIAAAIVWMAGTKLASYADVIAERTGLGRAFVGLLLLATATSLPEVATTLTAGSIGNAQLLTSNLFGSVVVQTAVLAAIDLVLVRKVPLTFFAPDHKLLIDGVMLVALLALAVVGIAVDHALSLWGVGPTPAIIFGLYVLMLWTTHGKRGEPAWRATNLPRRGKADAGQDGSAEHDDDDDDDDRSQFDDERVQRQELGRFANTPNRRLYLLFAAGALVILLAGYLLASTGDAIATQTGVGSTMVGVILVATGTALPEISTTAKAVRLGAHSMAISNIFGSNAFCMALLLLGDLSYRGGPILRTTTTAELLLAALGVLMTCAYLWGMLERRDRTFLGMGIGSFVVLILYAGGLVLLYSIS